MLLLLLLLLCSEHFHWAISDPHLEVNAFAADYKHFGLGKSRTRNLRTFFVMKSKCGSSAAAAVFCQI